MEARPGDALIVVDVQNDFLPGGALAVSAGDEVVPVLNEYIARFEGAGLPIFATRDWHPNDHCSFKGQGGSWPVHCVQGTAGAEFSAKLQLPKTAVVLSKGTRGADEAYSGFEKTELGERLKRSEAKRVFVGGLATDYCVYHTVLDALRRGFEVFLLRDAIRGVDAKTAGKAEAEMILHGAKGVSLRDLE